MKLRTTLALTGMLMGYVALSSSLMASEEHAHKVIEIKASTDAPVKIMVGGDAIVISPDELQDDVLLESRLADLDEETRETVMSALVKARDMMAAHTKWRWLATSESHGHAQRRR